MVRKILMLGMSLLLLVSCQTKTPLPTPRPAPSSTSIPTPKPTLTRTPTPIVGVLFTRDLLVNCRFGPGIVYEIIGELQPNQTAVIVGRDGTDLWWQIRDPGNPGGFCWVEKSNVDANDISQRVPVVNPPLVMVTSIEVNVEPPRMVINCSAFPQIFVFKGSITTNGPTIVKWRWEVSTGESGVDQMLIFEEAGTQSMQEFYRIQSPNDYSVSLHVFSPNESSVRANFFAQCTP